MKKDISKKELDKICKALEKSASQNGIPLSVIISASSLLTNHLLLSFVLGPIPAAISVALAPIYLIVKNKSDKDKMNSEYERIYNNLKDSYTSLYKRISKDCRTMMDTSLIYSLKLSAKRTNENIFPCYTGISNCQSG